MIATLPATILPHLQPVNLRYASRAQRQCRKKPVTLPGYPLRLARGRK
ncbi:hypothetical protein ACCUM_1633 [Candidatus Accumulibacter phosphatis]|uniref:Uncharacterized protein n=1 Tax=Candidatus Accumulibacter phosphatis TaxID=327160 RepID=A0A5S4ESK6_9PROT|nr:hypothetical protein ACCUM_1633 [Candidatus Accumulibacter phosphatis]